MNSSDGTATNSSVAAAKTMKDSRQPISKSTGRMSKGMIACPPRWPAARSAVARPRLRMNQFAIAIDMPRPTPATDAARAAP